MTTTYKQEATDPSPIVQTNCVDPLDMEQFINYDQTLFPGSSMSPLSRSKSASTPSSSNPGLPTQAAPQQTFAGPSHQYEQYKQQAGLPVGALANTFALNQPNQFSFTNPDSYDIFTPIDGYFGLNNTDDTIDFGTAPSQNSIDINMEYTTTHHDMSTLNSSFINPSSIGPSTPRTQPTPNQPGRVWPGMHQQQAALAKAQQEATEQRQQTATAEQIRNKLPSSVGRSSHSRHSSHAADPVVEESISRLLNQMRHNSVASSNDDDAATPTAGGSLHSARTRRDEEDMDEDERLLASEEGKKLSSKERRQLRNKVSARAFRSRRKEYIGQLEGELANKSQDYDELRIKNEELMAENTRLTDLTRMLLSSSAFSSFLNDLSSTGAPASVPEVSQTRTATSHQHRQHDHQQQNAPRKDTNPNQLTSQRQNNVHAGMAMIPESSFEYTAAESTNNGWNNRSINNFGSYDAQVFAVTSVPEAPVFEPIDFGRIHGKSSNFVGDLSVIDHVKDEPAAIEPMPVAIAKDICTPAECPRDDIEFNASDSAFALFAGQASCLPSQQPSPLVAPEDCIFGQIPLEKAFERFELVVSDDSNVPEEVDAATMERFARMCLRLDASAAKIASVTADL